LPFTPAIQLETLFILNESGCIVSTREPGPIPGPMFSLIRGLTACVWAVHANVPKDLARQVDLLAREEPPLRDFREAPLHERQYLSLLSGIVEFGPVFTFPDLPSADPHIVTLENVGQLGRYFSGWRADELSERAPIVGIMEGGDAVSVCFCARRSAGAAEAGLETAEHFRGRGLGPRVTAAWALAIRALGLLPLYSTSWNNIASLSVARKLGLEACATDWNVLPSAG
jgi:hypothetical protein